VLGITAFTSDNFPLSSSRASASGHRDRGGEEVKDPGRDLPRAIIGSLAIATLLYIAVAMVATGALPFDQLKGAEAPLATVLDEGAGISWGADGACAPRVSC